MKSEVSNFFFFLRCGRLVDIIDRLFILMLFDNLFAEYEYDNLFAEYDNLFVMAMVVGIVWHWKTVVANI